MANLPSDRTARKHMPIGTGCLDYFPDALGAVAHCSFEGQRQHNVPGPLRWDKSKSTDEADCLIRHFLERGTLDTDGVRHSAKVAWRALALLQREIEAEKKPVPLSPRIADSLNAIDARTPACPDLDQEYEPGHGFKTAGFDVVSDYVAQPRAGAWDWNVKPTGTKDQ